MCFLLHVAVRSNLQWLYNLDTITGQTKEQLLTYQINNNTITIRITRKDYLNA